MLVVVDLEITHMAVDNNGDVDNDGGPQILGRRSDLHRLVKICAMNRSIASIA
jgi:hypothetical protein